MEELKVSTAVVYLGLQDDASKYKKQTIHVSQTATIKRLLAQSKITESIQEDKLATIFVTTDSNRNKFFFCSLCPHRQNNLSYHFLSP